MAIKTLLVRLFALTLAGTAQAESYLCIAEKVTGFSFQNGKWVTTTFSSGQKWLVSLDDGGKVRSFDYDLTWFYPEDCMISPTSLTCHDEDATMKMSTATMRFSNSSGGSYVNGRKLDTPYIAIGTCAKL